MANQSKKRKTEGLGYYLGHRVVAGRPQRIYVLRMNVVMGKKETVTCFCAAGATTDQEQLTY